MDTEQSPRRIFEPPVYTFLPQPPKDLTTWRIEINHKSEVKTENQVWNLEWCDSKYNNNYGTRNKRMSDALKGVPNVKLSKTVLQLDKTTGEVIREWPSTMEVQRQLGYTQQNISRCCLGKRNQAYGFKWSYS